jgi:hypothetical protein
VSYGRSARRLGRSRARSLYLTNRMSMEGSEGGHTGSYLLATQIKPEDYFVEV